MDDINRLRKAISEFKAAIMESWAGRRVNVLLDLLARVLPTK